MLAVLLLATGRTQSLSAPVWVGRRELYRRFSRVSETLIEAADRVRYATVKEG